MAAARQLLANTDGEPLSSTAQAGLAVAVVAVVAIAGIMSGLTLGLLSMDRLDLELMMRTGSSREAKFARRLFPLILQPHWTLSTLVICNTAAGMALPLCLDRLVNVIVALVLSTTAIVIFGEILPQAVCSRYGLSIGGHAAPAVRLLMWLTAPISWPISKALDSLLGKEQPLFGKRQISALVDLHRESAGMGGPLNEEEAHVIQCVLDLSSKTGRKAMTPLGKVFMLSTDDVLDRPTVKRILDSGHSRVPVYRGSNRNDIIGLSLVKELLAAVGLCEPGSGPVRVSELRMRDLPVLPMDTPMTDLLNLFQTGHSHMALLLQPPQASTAGSAAAAAAANSKVPTQGSTAITALATCSSDGSHETVASVCACGTARSSDAQHGSTCSVCGLAVAAAGKKPPSSGSKLGALLRQVSSRALGRGASASSHQQHHQQEQQQEQQRQQQRQSQHCAYAAAADSMEAGTAAGAAAEAAAVQQQASRDAAALTAPHSGQHGAAAHQPSLSTVAVAAAAAAAVLHKSSGGGGLGRPSAASLWREAGWDPMGGLPVGIITLEDVLEELMGEEIVDETDEYLDNEKTCRVNSRVLAGSLPPGLRRLLLASQQRQQQRQAMQPSSQGGGPQQPATSAGGTPAAQQAQQQQQQPGGAAAAQGGSGSAGGSGLRPRHSLSGTGGGAGAGAGAGGPPPPARQL